MITTKSILELSELLENKEISCVEIANAYIDKIVHYNKALNAYITFKPEMLLIAADEADKRRAKGNQLSKFDGIPLAIKDNISTNGTKTTCGSHILDNYVPQFNATVMDKLEAAGFLLLGKANMDEFAMGSTNETSFFGPVKNPHDLNCVPGGSSGGSAAAVAAGIAPGALGSDTGGSIRQPSSFCGVVGVKPTYGRVSRFGLVAFASSLDQIGPITRNVDDASILLSIISGKDPKDSTSVHPDQEVTQSIAPLDISQTRIGVPEEYFKGVSDEIKHMISAKIHELEKMGAEIVPVSLKMVEYAVPAYYLIATAEASSNLARFDGVKYGFRANKDFTSIDDLYRSTRNEGFGAEVKRRIILGTYALSSGYYDAYYLKALKTRTMIINDFKEAFNSADVILSPVTPASAFKLGETISDPLELYLSDILTISSNLAAIPAMSVPVGVDSKGLPVGLQIMANHFNENRMLSVAKTVEGTVENIIPDLSNI
jgi:aspartyl-tRNA(Asn)/glutamyl-tRNA(Gln) amidotransferase subunit A